MANTKAYSVPIGAHGSGKDENGSVSQSSPTWVLSFVSWSDRDTLRTNPANGIDYTTVRPKPLVVENDCIQVSVVSAKGTLTPSMTATLVMTDVNYETAIAPGDFVIVNMLNWEKEARRVANKARNNEAINGVKDGFKGVFKVQGVRKVLAVIDQERGTKALVFKITGYAFTEFNNTIYFNQNLIDQNSEKNNVNLWFTNLATAWANFVTEKGLTNVQDIIRFLIECLIGNGLGDKGRYVKGIVKSPNTLFFIPSLLGKLLNVEDALAAKDVYNYLFGIQSYSVDSSLDISSGMNPEISESDGRFFYAGNTKLSKCQGETITKPEFWNQVQVWSILNQFTNSPLNELYTCFRVSPDGNVMPTVVFRQIPFTNDDFNANGLPVTRFTNVPRWVISPSIVFNMDIGRDESARINFVQYFGRSTLGPEGYDLSAETAQKNYLYDVDDVKRSGLRPYVVSSLFDEPIVATEKSVFRSVYWAKILGDFLIGGHLKMNGTVECIGIFEPIAVGDNLELDGVIYHIEQVSHNCQISPGDGKKTFRTTLNLTWGISNQTSTNGLKYAEMTYTDAYKLRQNNWDHSKILPGVSESQDVVYRHTPDNPDTPHGGGGGSFPQPNTGTSSGKSQRNKEE